MRLPLRSTTSIAIVLALCTLLTSTVLTVGGCAKQGVATTPDQVRLQVVRGVNDVSTTVVTANKSGYLSEPITAQILTINKQVLDVIEANPQDWKTRASVLVKNSRDALPANLAVIRPYLDALQSVIDGLGIPNRAALERGGK